MWIGLFLCWLVFVYYYVYLVLPITDYKVLINALDSTYFVVGIGIMASFGGLVCFVHGLTCILHEVQIELLSRAFRHRQINPILALIPPRPVNLYQRITRGLFTDPAATDLGRDDALLQMPYLTETPMSAMEEQYYVVQRSMTWSGSVWTPIIASIMYSCLGYHIYFFMLSLSGFLTVFPFMFIFSLAMFPGILVPLASVNARWEATSLQLERTTSKYLPEEKEQIANFVRSRPLSMDLLGIRITWAFIFVGVHVVVALPLVAGIRLAF